MVLFVGAAAPSQALPIDPGSSPAPWDPAKPVKNLLADASVGIGGHVGTDGGEVGFELPPPPVCLVATCGPVGPVGEPIERLAQRLYDTLSRQQVAQDVQIAKGASVRAEASARGGEVGFELPPPPVCSVATCGPVGPVGKLIIDAINDTLAGLVDVAVNVPVLDIVLRPFTPREHATPAG